MRLYAGIVSIVLLPSSPVFNNKPTKARIKMAFISTCLNLKSHRMMFTIYESASVVFGIPSNFYA